MDEARGVTLGLADVSREIGRVVGPTEGPTLIAVAGVHGNEPGGVHAARRVLARLEQLRGELRGEVVMLAGNVGALRQGRRYLARDLNRRWTDAALTAPHSPSDDPEDAEQHALAGAIAAAVASARGEVFLVDLHTTSAPGVPFVIFGDTERQRRFVFELPVPLLLGLVAHIDGTLAEYWRHRGLVTFAMEGGQHDDPRSVDNLAAALWVALASAGNVAPSTTPECESSKRLLDACRGVLPRVIEVLSRRAITADDRFVMEPGFANLAPAREGQLLARDRGGEIRAPHDGVVILPLYQALGSDGYFWGRAHAHG